MTADELVAIVQARGSDAKDARDAAHEACHALEWVVTKKWTRDNIHAKKPRVRTFGVSSEILARAVEQLVCRDLGVDCGSIEQRAAVCWMEMFKNEGIALPTGDWLPDAIKQAMRNDRARRYADMVLALRSKP